MTTGASCCKAVKTRYYRRIKRLAPGTWSPESRPPAPAGWRWLNLGERTKVGDLCCDWRAWPAVIEIPYPNPVDKHTHAILRRAAND